MFCALHFNFFFLSGMKIETTQRELGRSKAWQEIMNLCSKHMRTRICQEEFVCELVLKQTKKDANNDVNRGFVGGRAVETKE